MALNAAQMLAANYDTPPVTVNPVGPQPQPPPSIDVAGWKAVDPTQPYELPQKLTTPDLYNLYADYKKLKKTINYFEPSEEDKYRWRLKEQMDKSINQRIQDYFTPEQRANVANLEAQGKKVNYCTAGACSILNRAGEYFKQPNTIGGIYFGAQTAMENLEKEGYKKMQDLNNLKRGDFLIFQSMEDGKMNTHSALFDDYVRNDKGEVIGFNTNQNEGGGRMIYKKYVNDPNLVGKKEQGYSAANYDELVKNYGKAPENANGIVAFQKQFNEKKPDYKAEIAARNAYLQQLETVLEQNLGNRETWGGIMTELQGAIPREKRRQIF